MKLFSKIALVFSFVTVLALYFTFKTSSPVSASRKISSIEKSFNFLTLEELKLLKDSDLKGYLTDLSKAISKASFLEGVFKKRVESKVSIEHLFFEKAYADMFCPVEGLHPSRVRNEGECQKPAEGIRVTDASQSNFFEDDIENGSLFCPEGRFMCNPALVGFSFDFGKPKLRCLNEASNENCKNLKVEGEQLRKSLAVLEEASPDFWKEFEDGIVSVCFEGGVFKDSDESCKLVRNQMSHSAAQYRAKLTREYKDLAAKLEEASESSQKACSSFQNTSANAEGLRDHRNFDAPGQKIFKVNDRCWRLPVNTVVSNLNGGYQFLTPGKEDPIYTLNKEEGVFYNFQCGPCNDAKVVSTCLSEQVNSADDRDYETFDSLEIINLEDCRSFVSDLRELDLPEVVFEKYRDQGLDFYNSGSID